VPHVEAARETIILERRSASSGADHRGPGDQATARAGGSIGRPSITRTSASGVAQ
jgi:hypothetical protein